MVSSRKSIFVYIYGYLPAQRYGGPVTSIRNLADVFGDEYDIRIVCSNHEHGVRTPLEGIRDGWNPVGKAQVLYLPKSEYSVEKFTALMKPFNVQMVYLTGVFSYRLNHAAIHAARKLQISVVITLRGEICVNILAMKRWKKVPYLAVMRLINEYRDVRFQVTSDEEVSQLKKYLAIDDGRIIILPNLHGKSEGTPLTDKTPGSARIVFVSRIHPKKNLLEAIEAAVRVDGELTFDIYGPIEDQEYWKYCENVIRRSPKNVRITYRGELSPDDARTVFYNYHAFLFPTLTENYGHVIVDALLADCPVILSRGTTPWDDLDVQAGWVIPLHDIRALSAAVQQLVDMDKVPYSNLLKSLANYRKKRLGQGHLLQQYKLMIEGHV